MYTIKIPVSDLYVVRKLKNVLTEALRADLVEVDSDALIESLANIRKIEKVMEKEGEVNKYND